MIGPVIGLDEGLYKVEFYLPFGVENVRRDSYSTD